MAQDWAEEVASSLEVGTPGGPRVDISDNLTPELVAFYITTGFIDTISNVTIQMFPDGSGAYWYWIVGDSTTAPSFRFWAGGWVEPSADPDLTHWVHEAWSTAWTQSLGFIQNQVGNLNTDSRVKFANTFNQFVGPTQFDDPVETFDDVTHDISNGSDITIVDSAGSTSENRGFRDTGHTSAGAPTGIGVTPVQIVKSDSLRTYPNGRAFRVWWSCTIAAVTAVSTPVEPQILQGSNGTILRPKTIIDNPVTTVIHQVGEEWIFVNTSGADKTGESLSITLNTTAGTLNTQASVAKPIFFDVQDWGAASKYPWANSMV